MIGRRGFTLIEVLVVMTIIGILLRIATINFNKFQTKSGITGEISALRNELMAARAAAMFQHRDRRVALGSTGFAVYSSLVDTVAPVQRKSLKYPISYSSSTIDFDSQGFYSAATGASASLCVEPSGNIAAVDSLVIMTARIHAGKRVTGGGCTSASINVE